MDKPKMKKDVFVESAFEVTGYIAFFATKKIADNASEFGHMYPIGDVPNKYALNVDPRYDFGEVLDYIQNCCSNEKPEPFCITPTVPSKQS